MAGTQKEIYNVDTYTDAELYNILDLNNPTDRELEAKILNMIWKYDNMQNESGAKLSNFFKKIYDRFFDSDEDDEDNNQDDNNQDNNNGEVSEGMANMNAIPSASFAKRAHTSGVTRGQDQDKSKSKDQDQSQNQSKDQSQNQSQAQTTANNIADNQINPSDRTFSYNIPIDYSKDNLNPLLKQTTKRIVVIDSQYRENKSAPSTSFTFNLSNPLKDVVSLKLYSFQIPYTWYTINNNYGSNFFYLKGNTQGILNNGNDISDIQVSIEAGNYTAQTLVSAVNASLTALQSDPNFLDICFGTTGASYDNTNSLSKLTFDIKKIFNEGDYEIYFPYWDSPQIPSPPITNTTGVVNTPNSIPGFLGFNFPYYSPNVVYSIYNQLSGYSIAGLAGAYSPTNNVLPVYQYPSIDDTVNSFYLDASNNYFDIGITDKDGFIDPSNATVYGGIRVTLSLPINTYYTRNELVNELNAQLSINPFLDNTYSKLNRVFDPLYLYYMDPYVFSEKKLTTPPYMQSPAYPYLYLTTQILNPFYQDSNFAITKDYPMYPLYIQDMLQPDPTNTGLFLPNPFYNPQILDPSANIPQLYPFNTAYITNPFDPNGGTIPNPYDISGNKYIDNPFLPLFSAKTISYVYYIDVITLQSHQPNPLTIPPYSPSPTFPYLYLPKYIPNPFDPINNITSDNAYYPLYIEPYIQPDPANPATILPNPFYNPQLINQPASSPSFPFNTSYIPNPFDPNLYVMPNPQFFSSQNYPTQYDASGNVIPVPSGYMINPYYALATTPTITYKYYIDSSTFLSYYQGGTGSLNTIGSYVYLPGYRYMYLPKFIYNPFDSANLVKLQASINYAYWPLYNIPTIQPDPTHPSLVLPNPFYNPKISNPNATFTGPPYPFNSPLYIPNPFDPNVGFIPNPYFNQANQIPLLDASGNIVTVPIGYMINPYYALVSSTRVYYKYYIDSYTYSQQTINGLPLSQYAYNIAPTSPYLYVPQYIINPFYTGQSINPSYCYLPLYKQATIQPDPTNPATSLANPFYNPQISNPSAPIPTPSYPFNLQYIPNPFDPNGGFIPNPYDFSGNPTMINPYYALISTPTINYKFYIDSYTYTQGSLSVKPYMVLPTYPYLYNPKVILNPFISSNTITSSYPYYPLFTTPLIAPDPTNLSNTFPNPFFNAKLLNPSSSNTPTYPFNTTYIPNPFDPNGVGIPGPFYMSNSATTATLADGTVIQVPAGYMVNPYYSLTAVQNIKYKFYIDSYTYVQKNLFSQPYNFSPKYPYLYLPPIILNPFNTTNQAVLSSISGPFVPYYSLFTQPTIQPDPLYHPSLLLSNPFYNAKILNPSASNTPTYPFNTTYIPNPFDPNGTPIPSPYTFANTSVTVNGVTIPAGYMINPYYALLMTTTITYKYYLDPYTYGYFSTACQNSTFLQAYNINPACILNYTPTPIYPYEYVPQFILNPYSPANLAMVSSYPYWPLFTTPLVTPDPTNLDISFNNPFYNPKLLNPSATIPAPSYPFNQQYIPNLFDPNGGFIPNPYLNATTNQIPLFDASGNIVTVPTGYMINPYYPLVTAPLINYKFYIDAYTYTYFATECQNPQFLAAYGVNPANLANYIYNPVYPYTYAQQIIKNPFSTANLTMGSSYPYWPLFTTPLIAPDPTHPTTTLSNPFYNPQLTGGSALSSLPSPFNTDPMINPFDPNGGIIPNPLTHANTSASYNGLTIPAGYMINPYYSLLTAPTIYYKFYLDAYSYVYFTTACQNPAFLAAYGINPAYITNYTVNPVYPYEYVPQTILNPYDASNNIVSSYPYWPLFITPKVAPDPTNPNYLLDNPFYNPKLLNPADPIPAPSYPFNLDPMPNPFDPTGSLTSFIPNPYYHQSTAAMINPYYVLVTTQTIYYKFYIDIITCTTFNTLCQTIHITNNYLDKTSPLPIYPYLYVPRIILNPFSPSNYATLAPGAGYPYLILFILPTVTLDPTHPTTTTFYNPFYNPALYDSFYTSYGTSSAALVPIYTQPYPYIGPNNTMPNPFNPQFLQGAYIPIPSQYTTNYPNLDPSTPVPDGSMVNPYYAFFTLNPSDPNYVNHATPTTLPAPATISGNASFTNPAYNPSVITATSGTISAPNNIANVNNFANPAYNPSVITATSGTISAPSNIGNVNTFTNPGYNPVVNTDSSRGTISGNIFLVQSIANPAYNPNAITATAGAISVPISLTSVLTISNPAYNPAATTTNVPTDISNVTVFPNPAYNSKAVYDISNTLITNVGSAANPGYNPNAIYDNSNNDATIFSTIPNIYVNNKADYSTNNQYLNQIVTVPNPYYNPNITSEFSNPVNNWLGSSFSHYELRLKLNRLTMPIINTAYSKKPVPNVINQKITVKFPTDYRIWLGNNSAFLFNPQINPYPLSLMISESAIYEKKVLFSSTPTIQYKCVKPYYDISQNDYTAYLHPNIDSNGNIVPYNFGDYMNNINASISTLNTNSIDISNPNGIFRLGTNPSYLDGTSSNTLFYKNSTSYLNVATDITKTFGNYDHYLDLGTGNLIESLGLTYIQAVTGYDASGNPLGPIIYTDVSKNTYENSQYYGGYGLDLSGNFWVAVGQGGGNAIVYSTNSGNTWNKGNTVINSMSTNTIFTVRGNKVKYDSSGNMWVAAGKSDISGNTLAYSKNGISWTGLGNIISTEAKSINYSSAGNVWVAVGLGTSKGNTIACTDPSKNFVNSWSGLTNTPLDVNGTGIGNYVHWDSSFNSWVAVGTDGLSAGNTIVTSVNGKTWTAAPSNPFGPGGVGYHATCDGNIWVAVGSSPNTKTCIAYALPIYSGGVRIDGSLNWVPVYTDDLFKYGNPTTVSYNGNLWLAGGSGTNILATSPNGKVWTKETNSPTNAYNTFVEGINHIRWSSTAQKWVMLGNCGFSGNSIATASNANIATAGAVTTQLTVPTNQPFPSGQSISTTYNINLSVSPPDNTLTLFGTFPVSGIGYKFIAGNFITLIPKPTSANKFSGRELINITPSQADAFSAPNTVALAALINAEFSSYQDADGDYVLNNSNISLTTKDNTVYATLKIVIKKYLTQNSYNIILNDSADTSFNSVPTAASWQDLTNTWWKYLKIPYWNYPLYLDASGNYYVNGILSPGQLVIKNSVSTITNISVDTVRPNQLTIRDTAYTDASGNKFPVNNKIIIQPQTVVPTIITSGDTTSGSPNANVQRIPGWTAIDPTSGLTTDNVSDTTSVYNGYGYNTIIITVPNGNYSADELIAYINKQLNASPYIPTAQQVATPLLTYNQKCITFGSGFSLFPIPGVGNICELLFNINMIYDTRDYLLDFFDPYGFSICNSVSQNVKSTSWDSTLGWVLGFRKYTEYPLSNTDNAASSITSGAVTGNSLLQIIANNIANNIFTVTENQQQKIVDPSLQPHIITLQGDTAVSVNIYNYFLITLDDFNQNHLNDGLVTTSQTETDIPLPSYANRTLLKCDPTTQNLMVSNIDTKSTITDQNVTNVPRNLTQKQMYAAQEIVNSMQSAKAAVTVAAPGKILKQNAKYYSNGPFAQDVFAIVPLKLAGQQNNTVYVDYSGTLQNQERVYFGPVNIHRMTVSLVNDRGEVVNLNGANWTFSLICEQLYQQKKT